MGLEELRKIREERGKPKEKKVYRIPKKSAKKLKQEAEQKEQLGDNDTLKENWFKARRKEMVGVCQCGCAEPSCKKDEMWFRSSAAHIFPKATFPSVMYHPMNWVERNFWKGCHTNMDQQGLDKWVNFADWDDIKEKFHLLAPLLTNEERATKFYSKLESLIYKK